MKILCTNGWLRSNLGDLWMTQIILKRLREAGHELTVCSRGFPSGWESQGAELIEENPRQWNKNERRQLFNRFERIVHLPGGGLQARDPRMAPMLKDICLASEMEIPYALSGHSICPLVDPKALAKASLILAREPLTSAWLESQRIAHVNSVDPAWSQAIQSIPKEDQTLLMLRWDGGISPQDIAISSNNIVIRGRSIPLRGRLAISSSDSRKDCNLGRAIATRLNANWNPCQSLSELSKQIGASVQLITDRYHPTIMAKLHGVDTSFIGNDSVRNAGLRQLLIQPNDLLRHQSRNGLTTLLDWCATHSPTLQEPLAESPVR